MHKVFISYRRSDAAFPAGALARDLRQRLGEEQIFRDQEDIQGGVSWRSHVLSEIKADSVLLVLIGERWLEPATGREGSRLSDAADPVRIEIIDGLKDGATIIPILLEGAKMPGPADLPPELHALCDLNALKLRDGDWQHDLERICATLQKSGFEAIQSISRLAPPPASANTQLLSWKAVVAALLATLSLLVIQAPLDEEERVGSLVFACAALGLTVWAWYDVRRGRSADKWLTAGSTILAVVASLTALLSEPTTTDPPASALHDQAPDAEQTLPNEVEQAYLTR